MFARSSTPPTGPRSSSPARRGMGRGGIQKRRTGQAKVDKDGDLVMDPVGSSDISGAGRGYSEGNRSSGGRATARGGQIAGTSRGNFSTQQAQQAIIRGLESQQANVLESRISHGTFSAHVVGSSKGARRHVDRSLPQLRIRGLRDSKAASNPDGGVKDLLNFLERKASSLDTENRKGVRIQKVCFIVKIAGSL
jgi:nuclear RNA export factor